MDDYKQHTQTIEELNRTELSQHIQLLFRQEKVSFGTGLILSSLLYWARENLTDLDWAWMDEVVQTVGYLELNNPRRLYRNLETPGMEDTDSLEEAAMLCLSQVADFIPTDSF